MVSLNTKSWIMANLKKKDDSSSPFFFFAFEMLVKSTPRLFLSSKFFLHCGGPIAKKVWQMGSVTQRNGITAHFLGVHGLVSLKTKSWKRRSLKKRNIQAAHFFRVWKRLTHESTS